MNRHLFFRIYPPVVFAILAALLGASTSFATPLDDYVAKPDPAFEYRSESNWVEESDAFTAKTYKLTSQTWLDKTKVDWPTWEHWIVVIVPEKLTHDTALVFVNGGNNSSTEPAEPESTLAQVAVLTQSIVIDVKQIPNQHLRFVDETMDKYREKGRKEDELIAFAWDKFLLNQDPLWLPRLPMTKAVVRAMDLAQNEYPQIKNFFVSGGSKRGWATWTTAAVDERVIGIAPAVIDILNMTESLDHQHKVYGFWAPAISDYLEMDILSRIYTPEFAALRAVVDPYTYADRYTMPKYIINSAGDQFFLPDSWRFYFDELPGEKYLRYVPNTDHSLNTEAYLNMASFFHSVKADTPRPKFTWARLADGSLEVKTETQPTKVLLWQANNPNSRDFRLTQIGEAYTNREMEESSPRIYHATIPIPEQGWTAFFIELEFPNPDFLLPFKFTTGVSVVPDKIAIGE